MNLENIGSWQASDRKETPWVISPGYQFVEVITGGEVQFNVEGTDSRRTCGSIFWHIPGEKTVFRNNPANPYSCITFTFQMDDADSRSVPRYTFWDEPSEVVHFCRECLRLFATDGISLSWLCDYCFSFLRWKAYIYSIHVQELRQPTHLHNMNTYLDEADLSEITVETLAETVGISVPYLHQLFMKHRGLPPYQYILNLKMKKAKSLLASTGELIKTIGFSCGFSSPESFSRSFKKHIGMTPGEYRLKRGPYYRLR